MENLLEKFSPKCQGISCNQVMDYYTPSLNKYFWEACVTMNMVDEESVRIPNFLGIHGKIVNRKLFLLHPLSNK